MSAAADRAEQARAGIYPTRTERRERASQQAVVELFGPLADDGLNGAPALDEQDHPRNRLDTIVERLVDGADFLDRWGATVPAVWGEGSNVLWAEGESLVVAGSQGVGKTLLTGQLVRARLGLCPAVLGLPVAAGMRNVLYLAMDRPRQVARLLRRVLARDNPDTYRGRLVVWPGPPLEDVAQHPNLLAQMAEAADADTVVVDSIKDAAVGLSDDAVGAGYNRARQRLSLTGAQVIEQHHLIKKNALGGPPKELADVYGSVWLTAGAGSVVVLHGKAGDAVVTLIHLKPPAEILVGPWQVLHDPLKGVSAVVEDVDLVDLAYRQSGITARVAAVVLGADPDPDRNAVEKARRKLDALVEKGLLTRSDARPPTPVSYHVRNSR